MHCFDGITNPSTMLCDPCLEQMTPLEIGFRCRHCFNEIEQQRFTLCSECAKKRSFIKQFAALWEYLGPPATLIKKMKYGNQPHLAKAVAAYLVTQLIHLQWPLPDIIVPVPIPLTRYIERGYNQSALIAKFIATTIDRPYLNALSRRCGELSQAGLTQEQRRLLNKNSFTLKSTDELQDKTILLVDDVTTTGTTLNHCAATLMEGFPKAIYALTACKA